MPSSTYLFAINPISGGNDKSNLYQFIEDELNKKGVACHIFETTGKDDETRLRQMAKSLNPDVIVAVGGDGTLLLAAKVAMHTNMKVGLFPYGSANGMSKELCIPKVPEIKLSLRHNERYLQNWEIIKKGVVKEIDMLQINGEYYSLHLSDIGLNAKIVKRFESEKIRGYFGYARLLLKEMRQKKRLRYHLFADNKSYKGRAYMIVIANATKYGTGAIINPVGKIADGLFEICILKQVSFITMLRSLVSIFRPDLRNRKDLLKVISCKKAEIMLKKNHTLQVDGEVIGEVDKVSADILPGALKMIIPS